MVKSNKNFLLLNLAYGLPYGAYISVGTLCSNIFTPFGYTASDIAFIVLALMVTGTIGGIIIGAVMDRTQNFRCAMLTINSIIIICCPVILVALTWYSE